MRRRTIATPCKNDGAQNKEGVARDARSEADARAMTQPSVSVLIPTFDMGHFLPRALGGLFAQTFADWEAVIVDDGSRDGTVNRIRDWLGDGRVSYVRLERNGGLGAALNVALDRTTAPRVAYLPADDLWHADHLHDLVQALGAEPEAAMVISGVRYRYNCETTVRIPDEQLQLVQVMHRRSPERWVERAELTTDDLDRMYWSRLDGPVVETGRVTCEWVDHPDQRHKIVREPVGGINPYRLRYGVTDPLVFHSTVGNPIDEAGRYAAMRARTIAAKPDGLKILLVGELAYNADRVLALSEAGHRLYGLWMPDPYWYNWVGPLPFGHVEDLPANDWQAAVRRVKPDVIYALLNWQAIPFAHKVLCENTGVPFVWHFKEGPFIALEKGMWRELNDLYLRADGVIHTSAEMGAWTATAIPGVVGPNARNRPQLVLDGDLPKREWFDVARAPLLSETDGEVHTVVPGRPIGLHPENVAELANAGIHLHFYGDFTQGQWRGWIEKTRRLAGRFMHLHGNVDQENWVREFSRYDAGWLHFFESTNGGELRRANWDDLNIPARMATLAVCGLPMIQRDNTGHLVATQRIVEEAGLGICGTDMADVARLLHDRTAMSAIRERVWAARDTFTFDAHVDELTAFLRTVVDGARVATRAGISGAATRS